MASASTQPRIRLHIGGLPRELLEDDLRARFTPFGEVRSVEIMREKPNSPFFHRDEDGRIDESESDDDDAGGRGGRGGRGGKGMGGRGGRDGRGALRVRVPKRGRPPPCRGFAYVDLQPSDAKTLNRCVALYNGCKWKGGVLSVRAARLRFFERLRMEREGTETGVRAMCGGTESSPNGNDRVGDGGDEGVRVLRPGDALRLDGGARDGNGIVTVLFGKGAKTHLRGAAHFESEVESESNRAGRAVPWSAWEAFPEDASRASLRRLGQLPETVAFARRSARETEARFERRRRRMFARLGKDSIAGEGTTGEDSCGKPSDDDDDVDGGGSDSDVGDGESKNPDRFALPREFFASSAAAERASSRSGAAFRIAANGPATSFSGSGVPRARFGLGDPASDFSSGGDRGKGNGVSVELRALAAFFGGGDFSDDDSVPDPTAKPSSTNDVFRFESSKKTKTDGAPYPRSAPRDPDEGGVPMGPRPNAKWWETSEPENDEPANGAGGHLARRSVTERVAKASKTPHREETDAVIARDFFRVAGAVSFASRPRRAGTEPALERAERAAASVSEDALLRDWEGEESDAEERSEDGSREDASEVIDEDDEDGGKEGSEASGAVDFE